MVYTYSRISIRRFRILWNVNRMRIAIEIKPIEIWHDLPYAIEIKPNEWRKGKNYSNIFFIYFYFIHTMILLRSKTCVFSLLRNNGINSLIIRMSSIGFNVFLNHIHYTNRKKGKQGLLINVFIVSIFCHFIVSIQIKLMQHCYCWILLFLFSSFYSFINSFIVVVVVVIFCCQRGVFAMFR